MSGRKPEVALLGLGLIGGSLGNALGRAGWTVHGYDPDPSARRRARRHGLVETVHRSWKDAVNRVDIVVLCGPPSANLELLEAVGKAAPEATLTDVGSVKGEISRLGKRLFGDRFVPGHPMAGGAGSGAAHADADLFQGAVWLFCGGGGSHRRRAEKLARTVGARPVDWDAAGHDRDLARVSHLPQVVASLWVNDVARRSPEAMAAAGPVFREWARIADSDPELWGQILAANAPAVLREMKRLESLLAGLRRRWESGDNGSLPVFPNGRRTPKARSGTPRRRKQTGRR